MTTGVLAPLLTPEFFGNSGSFLVGGFLYTYQAGTTIPTPTYTDATLTTQLTNPIVLNSRGEPSGATGASTGIWVPPNVSLKYVLTDSAGNQIWSRDNVTVQQLLTLFGGIDTGAANTYLLTFSAPYTGYVNGTVVYWIPANNNSGASTLNINGYGVIPITNPNGSTLGANQIVSGTIVETIYYNGAFQLISLSSFTGSTVGTFGTETAIASAATTDLGSALAHVVQITGSTTITSFGTSASLLAPIYVVRFTGALTLTYNSTTMLLPSNASIVTTPGDALLAEYLGAGAWKVLMYQYSTGSANTKIKPADTVRTSSATLAADPDLQSNTLGIGRYAFEIYLLFDSITAGAGFQWTNGGTAADSRGLMPALVSGFLNAAAYGPKSETPYGATITYATVSTTANSNEVLYKGSLLVGTAGTFGVNWAQAVSTASATTLRAGSYLITTLLNTGSSATGLTHSYSSGTGTETIPSGYNTLTIEAWGPGGGGNTGVFVGGNGAGGGGGGAGGYCRTVIAVTGLAGDTVNWSVGAGGPVGFSGASPTTLSGGTLPISAMTAGIGVTGSPALSQSSPGSGGAGGTATGGSASNQSGGTGGAGYVESVGFGGGGSPGGGVSGIYGAAGYGGRGQGAISAATAGSNGQVIFTYSI
jgi:hypothetical protein